MILEGIARIEQTLSVTVRQTEVNTTELETTKHRLKSLQVRSAADSVAQPDLSRLVPSTPQAPVPNAPAKTYPSTKGMYKFTK